MNNTPTLRYVVVFLVFISACKIQAYEPHDFSLAVTVKKEGKEYLLTAKLKCTDKRRNILYVQDPTEFGKTVLLTKYNEKETTSKTTTTYSPLTYRGLRLEGDNEREFSFKFASDEQGSLYSQSLDQRLSIFENNPQIALRFILYVSDFKAGKSNIITVKSNFVAIDFPYKLSSYSKTLENGDSVKFDPSLPPPPK